MAGEFSSIDTVWCLGDKWGFFRSGGLNGVVKYVL